MPTFPVSRPSTQHRTRMAAAAAVTGVLIAGALTNAASARADSGQDWGAASQFISQINGARAANHRPRLAISSTLSSVAAGWVSSMARSNRLAHNPRLASSVRGWKYLGENVGVGDSVPQLESAFWDSAGHRANMLDRDFTQVGVAVVSTDRRVWVAEEFMRPIGTPASRPAASSARAASPSRPAVRPAAPASQRPTALQLAQVRLLVRLFAARHDSKAPNLDARTAQERTHLLR